MNESISDIRLYLDAIKKAFEYTEINCTIDPRNASEQLRKFIENLCQTMQNETQTENQIEMEGFIKEWNNQRKWLLNQVIETIIQPSLKLMFFLFEIISWII